MATVGLHARGDLVVWIQEHLLTAGEPDVVDGRFGASTQAAVEAFQAAHGLLVDGMVGPETWAALLRYRPATITWVRHGRRTVASSEESIGSAGGVTRGGGTLRLRAPASAALPARRDEIPAGLGAGPG
jgi:peptidoglycan hydrolase-like protein with peptidoglycan-binding domain